MQQAEVRKAFSLETCHYILDLSKISSLKDKNLTAETNFHLFLLNYHDFIENFFFFFLVCLNKEETLPDLQENLQ